MRSKWDVTGSGWLRRLACRAAAASLCVSVLALGGCRSAKVERSGPTVSPITPSLRATDPAYVLRPKNETQPPWYREMQVVFEQRPEDDKELEAHIEASRDGVKQASEALLQQVAEGISAKRSGADKWSVLNLTCGRVKKGGEIQFAADVGLTGLFTRRPGISFTELPMELCVAKLAREAGIQHSFPRGYSPVVSWNGTNISVQEAYDDLLPKYGFERRYIDTYYRVTLRLQDFAGRGEFVEAAVAAVLEKGKALNGARPAIAVSPREGTQVAEEDAKKTEEKRTEQAAKEAKEVSPEFNSADKKK